MTAIVEVFADVCCPFTHVGLRRLIDRRRALGRHTPRLVVRAWPLELVNEHPLVADTIAEEVDALRASVAPDLFAAFDAERFPPTSLPAFALVTAAYRAGDAVGEAVSLAVRDALFERGLDIGDGTVLDAIADEHGIVGRRPNDEQQAIDDWHEGRHRGVVGSPHFFVAGESWFCPTLSITRVEGRLQIVEDEAGTAAFLEHVLDTGTDTGTETGTETG